MSSARRFLGVSLLLVAGGVGCSDEGALQGFNVQDCNLFSNNLFDGGPGRDGIPALTHPEIGAPDDVPLLQPDDRVIGIVRNGAARAYPFVVMWWHEMVNDTLGGEPVLVTYCPLTGSGLAFDPHVGGKAVEFGVSGLIFENNLIMFDRETESLWPQLLTSARCGPLSGTPLTVTPSVETTWERWQEMYPQTTVVTTNTGFDRPYGEYPYGAYDLTTNETFLFPFSPWNITRPPKEVVLGVVEGEAAVSYPSMALYDLGEHLAVNDTIAGRPIVVFWDGPSATMIAYDRRLPDGTVLEFRPREGDPLSWEDVATGTVWDLAGRAVEGDLAGAQLTLVEGAYPVFWFAWSIFHRFARLGVG